jgi:hypothetical protein
MQKAANGVMYGWAANRLPLQKLLFGAKVAAIRL